MGVFTAAGDDEREPMHRVRFFFFFKNVFGLVAGGGAGAVAGFLAGFADNFDGRGAGVAAGGG